MNSDRECNINVIATVQWTKSCYFNILAMLDFEKKKLIFVDQKFRRATLLRMLNERSEANGK